MNGEAHELHVVHYTDIYERVGHAVKAAALDQAGAETFRRKFGWIARVNAV